LRIVFAFVGDSTITRLVLTAIRRLLPSKNRSQYPDHPARVYSSLHGL
jgi:hypothetical protein